MVLAEPGSDAVVHYHAVLTQHKSVATTADPELNPVVGIHSVEELRGVWTLYINFAKGGRIEDSHAAAGSDALPIHRIVHRLTPTRVVPGAFPLAYVFELRAGLLVPLVHGRLPHRVEKVPNVTASQSAEADWRVCGPIFGGADGRNI